MAVTAMGISGNSIFTYVTGHSSQVAHALTVLLAIIMFLLTYYGETMAAGAIAGVIGILSVYGVIVSQPTTLTSSGPITPH